MPQLAIQLSNNTIVGAFTTPDEVERWLSDNGFTYYAGVPNQVGSRYHGKIVYKSDEIEVSATVYDCKSPTEDWLPPGAHLPKDALS